MKNGLYYFILQISKALNIHFVNISAYPHKFTGGLPLKKSIKNHNIKKKKKKTIIFFGDSVRDKGLVE